MKWMGAEPRRRGGGGEDGSCSAEKPHVIAFVVRCHTTRARPPRSGQQPLSEAPQASTATQKLCERRKMSSTAALAQQGAFAAACPRVAPTRRCAAAASAAPQAAASSSLSFRAAVPAQKLACRAARGRSAVSGCSFDSVASYSCVCPCACGEQGGVPRHPTLLA